MRVSVLGAGFTFGVVAFALWLMFMLRQDRAHRVALVAAAQDHTRSHRRAARAAGGPPVARPAVPVVRAGSFCRVVGNVGETKHGTVLVCRAKGNGRPRWRRAEVFQPVG
jgi:hypothetical protein